MHPDNIGKQFEKPTALTASQILATHSLSDWAPNASEDITGKTPPKSKRGFINRRLDHVMKNNPDLVRDIIHNGVKNPVTVSWTNGSPTLEDGHDRVIIAHTYRPNDAIPITNVDRP